MPLTDEQIKSLKTVCLILAGGALLLALLLHMMEKKETPVGAAQSIARTAMEVIR